MEEIKNITEEEVRAVRRAYNKEYGSRPEVKEKRKEYNRRYWAKKAAEAKKN